MSWSRTLALGLLLWPLGCVVSVSDDPDGFGGSGGTFGGESGEGGDAGLSGSGGSSGSSGSSGESSGGTGGGNLPAPTCDAEQGDDECTQCLKQFCCDEWVACDDETCPIERDDVAECMLAESEDADSDTLLVCISESSASDDGLVQANTTDLIACAARPADDAGFETLCSSECFGVDIFFE